MWDALMGAKSLNVVGQGDSFDSHGLEFAARVSCIRTGSIMMCLGRPAKNELRASP